MLFLVLLRIVTVLAAEGDDSMMILMHEFTMRSLPTALNFDESGVPKIPDQLSDFLSIE